MATTSPSTEDDLTTCGVCFEIYSVKDNCPKFLSCHHTFCLSCIQGIVTHETMIRCPTCRAVTTLPAGNTIMQLRTNGHALKLAEYTVRSSKNKTGAGIVELRSKLMQEIAKLEKADKYLKVAVESLDVLRSHAVNTRLESTACLAKLKEKLEVLDNPTSFPPSAVEFSFGSSSSGFPVTLEKALDFQVGLNLESVSGQVGPVAKKIKLDLLIPVGENGLAAANLNAMSFSLLHFLKDELLKQPASQPSALPTPGSATIPSLSKQDVTPITIPSPTAPAVAVPVQGSPLQAPAARSPLQVFSANASRAPAPSNGQTAAPVVPRPVATPKLCYMKLNLHGLLDFDPRLGECDLVFETTPQYCAKLCKIFERGCRHTSDMNYRDCSFLRACPGKFVLFGLDENNVQYSVDPSLMNKPLIRQRGDVGLYCDLAVDDPFDCSVWDLVVLLSDYHAPHNLRPAPIVATLIRGLELCEELSRLRADERECIEISYIRVH